MKRIIAVALCGLLLMGCEAADVESVDVEETSFDLVSDENTGIIYIKNRTSDYHYVYTPYYSANGKLCRYDDEEIVEVEE